MIRSVAVTGAGALGCAYAGLLAAAGIDVTLLTAPDRVRGLAQSGVELDLPGGTQRIGVPVAATGDAQLVLVTAKTFGTEAALARISAAPDAIVSFQNGPDKNALLLARFGASVLGGASTLAAGRTPSGTVRVRALGQTFLGELGGGSSPRTEAALALLTTAGLAATADPDVRAVEWSKLAQVAATMGVQAVTRRALHEVFLAPDTAAFVLAVVREVAAVAHAEGSALVDRPGLLPVHTLAATDDRQAVALLAARGEQLVAAGRLDERTSLLRSLERGEPTEGAAIHGALVRRAEALGLPHPALRRAADAAVSG